MGSTTGFSDEKPIHSVTVSDYCMDMREFTNGDKAAAVFEGYAFPEALSNADYTGEKQPLIYVNWAAAKAICEYQDKRLPTEAEWEYAARGGVKVSPVASYEYGTSDGKLTDTNACWKKSQSCPVRSYAANPLGLYDMSGNVWEWVADWVAPYSADAVVDPQGPQTGTRKIIRGGSWTKDDSADLRAMRRNDYRGTDYRSNGFWFRCVAAPRAP